MYAGGPLPVTPKPTYDGFVSWVRSSMGVPVQYLPDDSEWLFYAYNTAISIVLPNFQCVPGPVYLIMVYNLAGHYLVSWTPDIPSVPEGIDVTAWIPTAADVPVYQTVDGVPYGFFAYIRKQNNILGFITGTVTASSDEGTSVTLVVPDQAKNLTLGQLQLTTTVWGRTYLGYAQDFGTLWGLS